MEDTGFKDILLHTEVGSMIDAMNETYVILKDYSEFNKTDFISCINNYIDDLKSEEFMENERLGKTWDYFFSSQELLKEMLVFYMDLDPYRWTKLFDDYTDYNTSEICEFIISHIEIFERDINEYKFYSSALDDY